MDIILTCCNCNNIFIVNTKEFNCKILRHGIYKSNYQQINPHLPKNECDRLFNNDLIYGIFDPAKNNLTIDMWVNSEGTKIKDTII